MNACKQSVARLKQLQLAIEKLDPQVDQLTQLLNRHQNDGDGSFNEDSWDSAYAVTQQLRILKDKVRVALEHGDVTEVGRLKKPGRKKP